MKKILIVEDELAYSNLLNDKLKDAGYEVLTAINGEKGLEIAKKEKPDLILLDIRMPVMDGMTMLTLLRKIKSIENTKIIVLTNLEPDSKIIDKVIDGEPSYYFVKSDISLNDLLEKVASLL